MRRMRGDRGATSVMVAVTLAALLGMAGLSVDAGALHQERRELSNGADAAVLAIAEDCALGTRPCDAATAQATAAAYAVENTRDGSADVVDLSLDTAQRTISVVTGTRNPDGTSKVRPFFAQVIGWEGATVKASATAIWGYPRTVRVNLPLIISECEFPRTTPVPTPERVLYFHDGNNAETCNAMAGMDTDGDGVLAGGFGWLLSDGCDAMLTADLWYSVDPGTSPPASCSPVGFESLMEKEIPIPIFDDLEMVGAGGRYHLVGFGLFHVTGYNFGGQYKEPATPPCSGDERCISGYFASGVVYEGEPGGEDWGFAIVKLTG